MHTITFDVLCLQPVVTSHLMLRIMEQVFTKGYPVPMAMPEALGESSQLGLHSNVFLLLLTHKKMTSELRIKKFTWSHRDIWL